MFKEFIAATKFKISVGDTENREDIDVVKGTNISYDGSVAIIEGREFNMPNLASAVKARWLVQKDELVGKVGPVSANIAMRASTPEGRDTVANASTLSQEETEIVSDIHNVPSSSYASDSDDSREVSGVSFQTRANQDDAFMVDRARDTSDSDAVKAAERKQTLLEKTERQKIEREIQSLREQLQVREGIQFQTENISTQAADTTATTTPDPTEEIWDGDDAVVAGEVSDDVLPVSLKDKETRLEFAQRILPDFNWDFSAHWKTKIKSLSDKAPVYVCTVYAVETDSIRQHIAKQFPELLA